jgi:peptidoglycan hydrolase-like protein with peptidoglycan-binding domain
MKGPLVRVWQYLLLAESPGFFVTGTFDLETEIATRQWQAKMGLPADGVVGLMSWERMLS